MYLEPEEDIRSQPHWLTFVTRVFLQITLMTFLRNNGIKVIPLSVPEETVPPPPKRQRTGKQTEWNLVLHNEPFNQTWNHVYVCEHRYRIKLFDHAAKHIDRLILTCDFHAFPEWTRDASTRVMKMVQPKNAYFPPEEVQTKHWFARGPTL